MFPKVLNSLTLLCVCKVHRIDHGILAYSEKVNINSKSTLIMLRAWEQCFLRSGRRASTMGSGVTDTISRWVPGSVSDYKSAGVFPIQTDMAPRQKPNWCSFNNSKICHSIFCQLRVKPWEKYVADSCRCLEMKRCFPENAWGVVRCSACWQTSFSGTRTLHWIPPSPRPLGTSRVAASPSSFIWNLRTAAPSSGIWGWEGGWEAAAENGWVREDSEPWDLSNFRRQCCLWNISFLIATVTF